MCLMSTIRKILILLFIVASIGCDNIVEESLEYHKADNYFDEQRKECNNSFLQSSFEDFDTGESFILVTGNFTMPVRLNTRVRLYAVGNLTFKSSMYIVDNCDPIRWGQLLNATRFYIGSLPIGDYIVAVDGHSFEPNTQGFPVLDRVTCSSLTVDQRFQGGDAQSSIALFTVRPSDETRGGET